MDLCQWANDADNTAPVEYEPKGQRLHARYANGVGLILRNDGWLDYRVFEARLDKAVGKSF